MESNTPVHELRSGLVRAAVWQNDSQEGPRYSVTFSRLYRLENEWKSSRSFSHDELPRVAEVAALAGEWIASQEEGLPEAPRAAGGHAGDGAAPAVEE
jgi:hypothetical protein